MNENKYFIKVNDFPEIEVSKDKFIEYELNCGFYPKEEGETATGGFGFDKNGWEIRGRIEYAKKEDKKSILLKVSVDKLARMMEYPKDGS